MKRYHRIGLKGLLLLAAMGFASCENMSSLKGPSDNFVAAANALAKAEAEYFDEIQTASDAGYRLQAAEDYVGRNGAFKDFIIELAKHDDFSKAKKLRTGAMTQLINYAEQVAAITSGASATWISDDAKATTANVSTLLKDAGDTADAKLLTSDAGAIEAAVTALGEAIVDSESAEKLQVLARNAQGPIAKIADMVKQDTMNIETDRFMESLKTDQTQAIHDILHFIYDDPRVNAFERLNTLQLAANWKPSLVTKGQAIRDALAKLQAANDALAKRQSASLDALSRQAYTFATQALNTPSPNTNGK